MRGAARVLAGVVALAAVILTAAGCAPSAPIDQPLGGALGVYDVATNTIYFDSIQIALFDALYPGTAEWVPVHEEGHRQTVHSAVDVGAVGIIRLERLAQCWAEAELGHGPPYVADATGYWDCPDQIVAQMGTTP